MFKFPLHSSSSSSSSSSSIPSSGDVASMTSLWDKGAAGQAAGTPPSPAALRALRLSQRWKGQDTIVPLRAAGPTCGFLNCLSEPPFVAAGDEPMSGQSGHGIGRWPQEARAGSARGSAAVRRQASGVTATEAVSRVTKRCLAPYWGLRARLLQPKRAMPASTAAWRFEMPAPLPWKNDGKGHVMWPRSSRKRATSKARVRRPDQGVKEIPPAVPAKRE